jgi:hypothetical protein
MKLPDIIREALDLTAQLHNALADTQFDACAELLSGRAAAMSRFEAVHRAASATERLSCREQLAALQDADAALQQAAAAAMAGAGQALRANAGASPRFGGTYDNPPDQACVDRKA